MKYIAALLVGACALVLVGTATTATQDKGRRLTGPFCIGKPYLRPLGAKGVPIVPLLPAITYDSRLINAKVAVLRAGVVRSVGANKPCRPWETRRVGVAIPCKTLTPLKPDVYCKNVEIGKQGAPGKDGATGAAGANGKDGANGANGGTGPAGASGKVTVTQLTGSQSNCVQISGSDGSSGIICGAAGAPGPKGDTGAQGPKGADGICKCPDGKCEIPKDPKYPK
jgi:hypothetical protein